MRTALIGFKEKSAQFVHVMRDDETNEVVAKTTLEALHLDAEQRKSCAFAEEIAAKMVARLSGDAAR